MPEEQAQGATPETTAAKPVAAADEIDDEPTPTLDAQGYKDLIRKLRAESRDHNKTASQATRERDELKRKLQERDDAELSETERLRKQLADLKSAREAEAQERQALADNHAIYEAAVEQHALKPAMIARLIDRAAIQRDEHGAPSNVAKLVKDLLAENPFLRGEAVQGVPGTPRANAGAQTWEDRVRENQEKLRATGNYQRL